MTIRWSLQLGLGAVLALAALAAPSRAFADDSNTRACLQEARTELRDCSQTCRDQFLNSTDLCRSIDPVCATTCRSARNSCASGPRQQRNNEIKACNNVLKTKVNQCKTDFANDAAGRDACIDAAQVEAFVCRDTAREAVAATLAICQEAFRGCIDGCGTP